MNPPTVTFKQFLENEFLAFHSGDHEWKKLIMVHHWPTTVCMVSVSAPWEPRPQWLVGSPSLRPRARAAGGEVWEWLLEGHCLPEGP